MLKIASKNALKSRIKKCNKSPKYFKKSYISGNILMEKHCNRRSFVNDIKLPRHIKKSQKIIKIHVEI